MKSLSQTPPRQMQKQVFQTRFRDVRVRDLARRYARCPASSRSNLISIGIDA